MKTPDQAVIAKLNHDLDQLRQQPCRRMRDFKDDRSVYDQHTYQGVYAVTDPDDDDVVYVGKTNSGTKEKGIADRIWGHLAKGSDLQSSLGVGASALGNYNVRVYQIDDSKDRGLTELFGIAVYAPPGNRYGYKGISTDLDDRTPTA